MNFPTRFIAASREYCDFDRHIPAPYIRRSFELEAKPAKAEILICGLGFYRLFINGAEITRGALSPYISNPDDLVYYDWYDITAHLTEGENVIGVILGNGFQNPFGGINWKFAEVQWRGVPRLALRCEITGEDGSQTAFETDEETFLTSPSPILFDEYRYGERYDARLEQEGWAEPGFDDSGWAFCLPAEQPRGQARLARMEPIVVRAEHKPVSITPQQGGYLYDFGLNSAGVCRLTVKGKKGQKITFAHSEALENGEFTMKNILYHHPEYNQTDVYICKGRGVETYVPGFTYHGFRYVLVKGITEEQATSELLTYLEMSSDLAERGGFSCSDETANTLQTLTRRSTLANFYHFPTDCPHREKNGWTGDAALSAEHTLLNLAPEKCYAEWLANIRAAQREDGALPGIVPTGGWGFHWGNGPAWDMVLVWLPYYTYRYRGDKQILADNAASILRYLHYMSNRRNEKGLLEYGLGDWCPPGRKCDDYKAPLVLTDTLIGLDIARKSAEIFGLLGMKLEKAYADILAGELLAAARSHLVDPETQVALGNCQTSQALCLWQGVFTPEQEEKAFAHLLRLIEENGRKMDTGILGARVIFHLLSRFGYSDLAFEMIVTPDFPSYGNWVKRGATSLWESFREEDFDCGSFNHHFFGDISSWFIQWIAGIQYNNAFTRHGEVLIRPQFIAALTHAEGFHIAPEGRIESAWKREGENVLLRVTVPEGITGKIALDGGWKFEDGSAKKAAASGEYRICKI